MLLANQVILHQLEKANSLDDIWDIAVSFFNQHGITHLIYSCCCGYKNSPEDTILLTTMPDWWIRACQNNSYAEIDPYFTHYCKSYKTLKTGIEYYNDYDFLNQTERKLIEEASQAGFLSGAGFAMRKEAAGEDFGGWNLGTTLKREEFDKLYAEKGEMLRIVAMYMHEQISIKLDKDIEKTKSYAGNILSNRQVECLKLLAKGKRIQQIAGILNIKPVTVDHHIKLARENLHATTREQAIARAIIKGLIILN